MAQKVTVALDAMGGDNAPDEIVKGAIQAVEQDTDLYVELVGDRIKISGSHEDPLNDRITVVDASEVIETSEHPVRAIRAKKDSSMVRALERVKEGYADAILSAGNSGALLVGGQLIAGRIKGIDRPCLAPIIPTPKGPVCLVDAGANMDAKPSWLLQWAYMGSIYMQKMFDKDLPSVAIVNVGEEEEKGNRLVQEAFPLLKEAKESGRLGFTGSIEAREITKGDADVVVCDAFVGNVILKMYEGVADTLLSEIKKAIMSGTASKIGGMLIKKSLKDLLKTYNAASYGGAVLLGTKGVVVKAHGNSKADQISIALGQIASLVRGDIVGEIKTMISTMPVKVSDDDAGGDDG